MIITEKRSVVIADAYCDEKLNGVRADVVRRNQCFQPAPGFRYAPFRTLVLDLTKPQEALLEKIDQATRYKIRRAEKDGLSTDMFRGPSSETALPEFCEFFHQCASLIGLPPADRGRLAALARCGSLVLSRATKDGDALAWHVYYVDAQRAVQLYSMASQRLSSDPGQRQVIGRANRYLHWQDILQFKAEGLSVFDFGGWYNGKEDKGLLQINQFKEEFGGNNVEVYNSIEGKTVKGKLAVWYLQRRSSTTSQSRDGSDKNAVKGQR
jgi:hypothetical protein